MVPIFVFCNLKGYDGHLLMQAKRLICFGYSSLSFQNQIGSVHGYFNPTFKFTVSIEIPYNYRVVQGGGGHSTQYFFVGY